MLLRPADKSGGSYVNLFDAHPPFQIDGNFGGAAGIAEMLLQSHTSFIELLPALPMALKEGEIKGMKVRGGFEFDFSWENSALKSVKIKSLAGEKCQIKYLNRTVVIDTKIGEAYSLNGDLQLVKE
jgi:alpha-L-fucosidase 2